MCRTAADQILGCGMVHPAGPRSGRLRPEKTGFAWGIGIERVAILRYQVEDIRPLRERSALSGSLLTTITRTPNAERRTPNDMKLVLSCSVSLST
jgi:hypothetical protein